MSKDTLQSTFDTFFGPSEDTAGTGAVIRVDEHDILHTVIVDPKEHAAWQAQCRAEANARNALEGALWQLMSILNT